jgi:predicted Zn-dependent protease
LTIFGEDNGMKGKNCFICLFLAALLVFNGCATSSKEIRPDIEAQLMSEEDEVKFGYYVDAMVCNEFPVLKKERLTKQVAAIGNSLAKHSLRPDLDFTFKVLNTETANAFAGPGGFVYITVGLLDELESKEELAAILGHEIGHCCARHSIKAWKSAQKISRTLTIIDIAALVAGFPPVAGAGGDIIANVGQNAAYLASMIIYQGYSRGYEYQADELGLRQMYEAGYAPEAMLRVFDKFIKLREDEGRGKSLVILSSHPHLEDRIQHVREFIKQLDTEK